VLRAHSGSGVVSSVFFMCLPDRVLVYGDCAVNVHPEAEELAAIAITSADTAKVGHWQLDGVGREGRWGRWRWLGGWVAGWLGGRPWKGRPAGPLLALAGAPARAALGGQPAARGSCASVVLHQAPLMSART
jgi:hypothetical protein